eukprot:jgi/Botrbrau1/3578/Bobra.0078s0032.1
MVRTAFTEAFGVALPLVGAPMDGVSYADLAGAVAKAGGLGMVACGIAIPVTDIHSEYQRARDRVNGEDPQHSKVGIGLINFLATPDRLEAAISCQPDAIWLSFPETSEDWEKYTLPIRAAGIKVICQVQSIEQALHVARLGADAIVAQGYESGGHGSSRATTWCFVPEVVDALRALNLTTPVLAAGGVADGRQVAAAFALGADGVVLGTRLCCTEESRYPDHSKKAILQASDSWGERQGGRRTSLWDQLGRGPGGARIPWPPGIDGRTLENGVLRDYGHKTPITEEERAAIHAILEEGRASKDSERTCIWAGGGAGLIHSIGPTEEVLKKVADDLENAISRLHSLASN